MNTCKVIAIENQKGGTGKSTTALNLGVGLSQAGKSVLLIDSDPQASLTLSLGVVKPDDLKVNLSTVMIINRRRPKKFTVKYPESIQCI